MHDKVITCDQKLKISRRRQAVATARLFKRVGYEGNICGIDESFSEPGMWSILEEAELIIHQHGCSQPHCSGNLWRRKE
jgi:hypothetical protein